MISAGGDATRWGALANMVVRASMAFEGEAAVDTPIALDGGTVAFRNWDFGYDYPS